MRTVTLPYLVDTRPAADKTPAPLTEVERFMAANLFQCELLAARITVSQCQTNRLKDTYLCGKCNQERPVQTAVKPAKRRKGDNPDRAALCAAELVKADESRPEPVKAVQTLPEPEPVQRAEGRGQRAEGRGQRRRRLTRIHF